MGKQANKQVVVDIEAEYNDEGEIDVVLFVDDEPDFDGLSPELPPETTGH
jgi:hypothetical protein